MISAGSYAVVAAVSPTDWPPFCLSDVRYLAEVSARGEDEQRAALLRYALVLRLRTLLVLQLAPAAAPVLAARRPWSAALRFFMGRRS